MRIFMALVMILVFSSHAFSQTRKEILALCDDLARSSIKRNYIEKEAVNFLGLTSWLSGEFSDSGIYRFTAVAKIRDQEGALYSWTFLSFTQFDGVRCSLTEQRLDHITKLIEEDEEDRADEDMD